MYDDNLRAEILQLKRERNALILAHNYQRPEVQDIADECGDSLELAHIAYKAKAEVIVLCGVHFMAETAAILSPSKTVLLPRPEAGGALADMMRWNEVAEIKKNYPQAAVVSYINTTAEIKALSDIICTSANAVRVVKALPHKQVIFLPDRNLGEYVQEQLPDKRLILWGNYCPTHAIFYADMLLAAKAAHPAAVVLAHPECLKEVRDRSDHVLGTGGMVKWALTAPPGTQAIIATEVGMVYRLRRERPDLEFFPASEQAFFCESMKLTRLVDIREALVNLQPKIKVAPEVAERARLAIAKMMEIG